MKHERCRSAITYLQGGDELQKLNVYM